MPEASRRPESGRLYSGRAFRRQYEVVKRRRPIVSFRFDAQGSYLDVIPRVRTKYLIAEPHDLIGKRIADVVPTLTKSFMERIDRALRLRPLGLVMRYTYELTTTPECNFLAHFAADTESTVLVKIWSIRRQRDSSKAHAEEQERSRA